MRRRTIPIIAMVVLTSGCAAGDPKPDPTPTTSTTTTSTTTTTTSSARPAAPPEVGEPLDLRALHKHPCAALTPAQQKQIGFNSYDPVDHEGANDIFGVCVWKEKPTAPTDGGYGYRVTLSVSGDPLAKAYADAAKPDGSWNEFEPREIGGLPAVVGSITSTEDQCDVVVGTGNGQGIEINGTVIPEDPTLCDRFVKAAEWIVAAARR